MNQVMDSRTTPVESSGADGVPVNGANRRLLFWGIVIVLCHLISELLTPYPAVLIGVISEQWWDLLARKSLELIVLAFLIPQFLKRDGLSLEDIGFAPKMSMRDLRWGLLGGGTIWLLHVSLLRAAEIRTGGAVINMAMTDAVASLNVGHAEIVGLFFAMVVQGPFLEEVLYRGCLMASGRSQLGSRLWSVSGTVLLSGLVFAAVHALGHPLYSIVYAVTGLGLALLYQRTGSLAAAIFAHATVNSLSILKVILVRTS